MALIWSQAQLTGLYGSGTSIVKAWADHHLLGTKPASYAFNSMRDLSEISSFLEMPTVRSSSRVFPRVRSARGLAANMTALY